MITPRALGRQLRTTPLPRRPVLPRWWRRLDPVPLVWLAVWAPWWVGNELAPPASPRSRELEMSEQPEGTPGAWLLDTMDDLKFRFGLSWAAALLVRGAWLGGVAGIGWITIAMLTGAPSPSLRQIVMLVGAGAALGLVLRGFHRPRYTATALLLERAFQLRSRLSTAIIALRFGSDKPGELHALQLADAANTLERARGQLRPIHWVPVREIFIAFIVALTLLLLLVAQRPEGEIPSVSSTSLPGFVPVSERLAAQQQPAPVEVPDAATLEEVEDLSRTSNQARQDLDAIRDALDDTTQTVPAADAIASEDYPTANERLDAASEAVTQLPESEREALADQLEEAAGRVSEDNADLADAAREASDDVRSGEDSGAIDELGDRIEETGEDVIPREASGRELSGSTGSETQSGAPGSSQSGAAEQQEPADQGSGSGEPGQSGDPGAGMEASGGTGESGESGQTSDEGTEGAQGGEPSADASGSSETVGEAQQEGSGGQGSSDAESDTLGEEGGEGDGSTGESSDEAGSQQGAGAGGGQREGDERSEAGDGGGGGDVDSDEQAPESGEGEAGDPPPGGESEGDTGDSGTTSGGAAISLPGTSGERVASGSDVGASSVGSGGGVGAASGDSTSGVSGSTGPDPNTVPAEWRDIVERYFREGGAP